MKIQEVLEQAKQFYAELPVTPENVKHWVAAGLIPKPTVTQGGKGVGKVADYPEDTPAQLAAAAYVRAQGYSRPTIAQARKIVLEGAPVDDDVMRDVVDILTHANPGRVPGKKAMELAGAVQRYSVTLAMARGGRTVSRAWGQLVSIEHGKDVVGRDTFTYYVSLPGLYWDPRVEGKQPDIALDIDQQIRAQRAALRKQNGTD